MQSYLNKSENGILLSVRVIPNSSKDSLVLSNDDFLKLKVAAPPVGGKANKRCIEVLAKALGIRKSGLKLTAGKSSRNKVFLVNVLKEDEIEEKLNDKISNLE